LKATTELVNSLKHEAHTQQTSEQQRKLLLAAKLLAEATSKMVEAAKGCATNPKDLNLQNNLKKAAEELKNATTIAAGDNLQLKLIKRLELCAKQAASCATQSIAAIHVCTIYSNSPVGNQNGSDELNNENTQRVGINNQTHNQLIQQCKQVADHVPKIVQGENFKKIFLLKELNN
jgi:talin